MQHSQSFTGRPGAGDLKITAVFGPDTHPLGAAYVLTPEQAIFFKKETGIDNDDDLKSHILHVQEESYKVFPYNSIRMFKFLWLGIARQPEYKSIIKLGQERPDGILLDIGCCFGVDARKAIADGFPLKNVVTTDLRAEFFDMSHALFRTTPETYPIKFIAGDAFDPGMLQIVPPFNEPLLTEGLYTSSLTSLNPLAGCCAVIYASNFFHLFSEDNQLHLARAFAGLLSPLPGSMICGEHIGNWEKGTFHQELTGLKAEIFQHSPESWAELWDGEVFVKGTVRVEVKLERVKLSVSPAFNRMQWSVVRL